MKSFFGNYWKIPETFKKDFFENFFEKRNIENSEKYLKKDYPNGLFNGKLLADMQKSVKRVIQAIKNKERIVIFGDYDCDGIPGTAISVKSLQKMGALVVYKIPHREKDGYGLKKYFLEDFKARGISLVITVDNGIASFEEAEFAKEIGIDLIITDHHAVQESKIPNSFSVINPQREDCKYPFKNICGAVVAWKFMIEIGREFGGEILANEIRDEFVDFAGLSTVTDIMPIISENRIIVGEALKKILKTKNPALQKLFFKKMKLSKDEKIGADFFGFRFGPIINAPGRIDDPVYALEMLLGIETKVDYIFEINEERKKIVENAFKNMEKVLKVSGKQKVLIFRDDNLKAGVIGLVAGEIQKKFNLPSIVLTKNGDFLVASARSFGGFSMFDILNSFKNYFEHFGGHANACGFSILEEKFKEFKDKIIKKSENILKEKPLKNEIKIDFEIKIEDLDLNILDKQEELQPFGYKNSKPIFG